MNILYLADPASIHDAAWINNLASRPGNKCHLVVRKVHESHIGLGTLHANVRIVAVIEDFSTIRPLRNLRQILRIKSIVNDYNIHLIHILYAEPNSLWANGKRCLGVPIVITTRGSDVLRTIPAFFDSKSWLKKVVARQYRSAFANADAITCTSSQQRANVRRFAPLQNISIIRTGVDVSSIEQVQSNVSGRAGIDRPFVLMPRKMDPVYNHEFTLDAITLLSQVVKEKFAFVFLDADSHQKSYVKFIREKAQFTGADVRFLPLQTPVRLISLYKQSTLVVMNPHSDGSPVTAMEAMACGKPVILPPLPYDEEIFSGAFFFKTWSPLALKDEIEQVLKIPADQLEAVVQRNMEVVRLKADFRREMTRVENIYLELMNGKSFGVPKN